MYVTVAIFLSPSNGSGYSGKVVEAISIEKAAGNLFVSVVSVYISATELARVR